MRSGGRPTSHPSPWGLASGSLGGGGRPSWLRRQIIQRGCPVGNQPPSARFQLRFTNTQGRWAPEGGRRCGVSEGGALWPVLLSSPPGSCASAVWRLRNAQWIRLAAPSLGERGGGQSCPEWPLREGGGRLLKGPPPSPPACRRRVGHCSLGSGACPSPPQIPALYFMLRVVSYFVREIFDIFKNNLTQREQQKFCTKI